MYCIDASVIVNSIIEKEAFHEDSVKLLDHIIGNKISVVFPNIVIPEVSSAISRGTGSSEQAKEYIELFISIPNFTFIPIDKELSLLAAKFAAEHKLRGADSLYVAVSHLFGFKLITLDEPQRKSATVVVKVMTPEEELKNIK